MADGPAEGDLTGAPFRLLVEFAPGTEIAGSVRAEGPEVDAVEFRGRLELYAAIERAREGRGRLRPSGR